MSRITKIRTIRIGERPNLIWAEVTTDEGLTGLGEAFRGAAAVEAVIHESVAPLLLGRDARDIEAISRLLLTPYVGFGASSAEVRAASAIDIALWDLAGPAPRHPGARGAGRARARPRPVLQHLRRLRLQHEVRRRGATSAPTTKRAAPMTTRSPSCAMPARWPESLLSEGFNGHEDLALRHLRRRPRGARRSRCRDLKKGAASPSPRSARAVGDRMEIMAELHGLWSMPAALRICQALEQFDITWAEDPIAKMDDVASLAELRRASRGCRSARARRWAARSPSATCWWRAASIS